MINILKCSWTCLKNYVCLQNFVEKNQCETLNHGENIKVWSKKILTTCRMTRKSMKIEPKKFNMDFVFINTKKKWEKNLGIILGFLVWNQEHLQLKTSPWWFKEIRVIF